MIQYPTTQYQDIGGLQDPITIRQFQGVNTFDPFLIDDTNFTDMSNLTTDDYPALSVRPGFTVVGQYGARVLGIGFWKTELHAIFSDGTWRNYVDGSWSTLASGVDISAVWSFTVFQGNWDDVNLVGVNGVEARRYDGSSVSALSGVPDGLNYITTYQNRLWGAVGNEVHACALNQPEEWELYEGTDEDSYAKTMESTRGEDVNMLSGSLTKLTIGMPSSLHEMYGELPSNFTTKAITDDSGVLNNQSKCTQNGTMRIIGDRGIYDYAGGSLPNDDFSEVIGGYISSIDSSSCAGADADKLYFRTASSTILVYDTRASVSAWSVWRGINPIVFATYKDQLYIGDSSGRVLKMSGTDDNGTAISWYAVTKPFTNGSMAQKMRWYKMYAVAELASGSTFNVYLSKSASGDDDWELVQHIEGSGTIKAQRVIIPVSKYARENYIRIKFSGTGWMRLHEYTRQQRQLPLY